MNRLNSVKNYLKNWFENHPLINTTVVSTSNNFASLKDVNYPVAHCEYVNRTIVDKLNTWVFNITLADIQNNTLENRNIDQIQNEMNLIADDFLNYHYDNEDVIEIDNNVQITPFEENNTDRTSGVTFAIRLTMLRDINDCSLNSLLSPNK